MDLFKKLTWILFACVIVDAKYSMKPDKISCSTNNDYITEARCEVKNATPDDLLTIHLHFEPGKLNNVWAHTKMFRKHGETWEPFLLNLKINLCDFLEHLQKNELFRSVHDVIDILNPQMKEGCPLKGSIEFIEKPGNDLLPQNLPPIFPTGYYHSTSRIWIDPGNITVATIDMFYDLILEIPDKLRAPILK